MNRLCALLTAILLSDPAFAQSGCPGEYLVGVHTSPDAAWSITVHNGGTVVINRIGGGVRVEGAATMLCVDNTVLIKLRSMSHGLNYDCVGELQGEKIRGNIACVNADTSALIGHIRGQDAKFE